MNLRFADEEFVLLADRAILWPRRGALLIADPHFGKDALFQARGIPVPTDVTAHDLARLAGLATQHDAREVIVLGDFFHGRESNDAEMTRSLKAWRDARPHVALTLIRGNHDRHAGDPDASLDIECLNSLTIDAVRLQHEPLAASPPTPESDTQILCGHVHPAATLADFDGSVVKLPCFVVEAGRQLILPAFGRFTGTAAIPRAPGRELMISAGGRVIRAPTA